MDWNRVITATTVFLVILSIVGLTTTPAEAGNAVIPPSLKDYVEYAYYDGGDGSDDGVELKLTLSGIYFGRTDDGAWRLAGFVRTQPEWKGSRSHENVASEIKWHCKAWNGYPYWWRDRLNPVNIEYYQGWPQSAID